MYSSVPFLGTSAATSNLGLQRPAQPWRGCTAFSSGLATPAQLLWFQRWTHAQPTPRRRKHKLPRCKFLVTFINDVLDALGTGPEAPFGEHRVTFGDLVWATAAVSSRAYTHLYGGWRQESRPLLVPLMDMLNFNMRESNVQVKKTLAVFLVLCAAVLGFFPGWERCDLVDACSAVTGTYMPIHARQQCLSSPTLVS